MWQKMIRNLEWLLIVALLVGAVMAVGCGKGEAPVEMVANAGPDQPVALGVTVTLDGSATTYDINAPAISYIWSFEQVPVGSALDDTAFGAKNGSSAAISLTFVPDKIGTYVVSLGVTNDGGVTTDYDWMVVSADYSDLSPIANAGSNFTGTTGTRIFVDGSASSDPNNTGTFTYAWTMTSKPASSTLSSANIYDATTANASFVPDVDGPYVFSLVVYNGLATSTAATVTVTASTTPPVNTAPVANAGSAQSVTVGSLVTLNGSASSDADGNTLTYLWYFTTRPVGSSALLTNAGTVAPSFTPDVAGGYVANLVVNDGTVNSTIATVTITVVAAVPSNTAPVANAGPDQSATVGNVVTLSGNMSSDANGNALTYSWTLIPTSGSSATLTNANTVSPTFTPNVIGDYTASLIVNDGMVNSAADTVIISAAAPVGGGTPAYVTDLKNLLTDNSFLITHITASSGLLEVLEFGPYGPGGSMTFTYINPYFSSQSPHVRRTGSWMVLDGGGFAQASESLLFASRVLNTGSPVDATSSLTMTGYSSYSGITDPSVESWVKVAPLTVNDLAGRTFTSYPYSYSFTSDGSGSYGNAYSAPLPFTWLIDSAGRKAVLTFANGSTHQLFMTVRGLSGSVDRELGILALDSNGSVNSSSLMNWSW